MRLSDFDFHLPAELIAQHPAERRQGSRMMVVRRGGGVIEHARFEDITSLLRAPDVLVANNTRVRKARVLFHRPSGGAAELLLCEPVGETQWRCLARPASRMKPGAVLELPGGVNCRVAESEGQGFVVVEFPEGLEIDAWLDQHGAIPLPRYIRRDAGLHLPGDEERYQTVYSRERGAIAAPTAGLHFTPEIIARLQEQGVKWLEVTLHVGAGTFLPVRAEDVREHRVSPERSRISGEVAAEIERARATGSRVIAVGTTTVRTLESSARESGRVTPGERAADLTIVPGYRFQTTDAMLTNFHLPMSSLLLLVSAFAGRELILQAYRQAVEERYRFFSYGDCMLIL
ncbi:MAG: S-adenosylmethionine:tRNA ribosyltransferase-isomerase [Myxococcota bacterium]|nr:S-adenosylmethionine:tRNA ribosyltransferase-isomerase [Myxococcota bacterium]